MYCFQITYFKERKNIAVEKILALLVNFYLKNNNFQLSHGIKNIYISKL